MGENLQFVDLDGASVVDIQSGAYHMCALLESSDVKDVVSPPVWLVKYFLGRWPMS